MLKINQFNIVLFHLNMNLSVVSISLLYYAFGATITGLEHTENILFYYKLLSFGTLEFVGFFQDYV